MTTAAIKSVCVVLFTGIIAVATADSTIGAVKDIIEVSIAIAGIIGVAYVMRADVATLKKWAFGEGGAESRLRATEKNTEVVTRLLQGHDGRLDRIERHEDDERKATRQGD